MGDIPTLGRKPSAPTVCASSVASSSTFLRNACYFIIGTALCPPSSPEGSPEYAWLNIRYNWPLLHRRLGSPPNREHDQGGDPARTRRGPEAQLVPAEPVEQPARGYRPQRGRQVRGQRRGRRDRAKGQPPELFGDARSAQRADRPE